MRGDSTKPDTLACYSDLSALLPIIVFISKCVFLDTTISCHGKLQKKTKKSVVYKCILCTKCLYSSREYSMNCVLSAVLSRNKIFVIMMNRILVS